MKETPAQTSAVASAVSTDREAAVKSSTTERSVLKVKTGLRAGLYTDPQTAGDNPLYV